MRTRALLALSLATVASACAAPPRSAPAPAPPPARPVPLPRPAPARPPVVDWRDGVVTPGDWSYAPSSAGATASFDGGAFAVRCDRGAGAFYLTRRGQGRGTTMVVRTSSETRSLPTQAYGDGIAAVLPVTDRLVDAMGFSRGRFVVEAPPLATLVVPAYAEILRVVEDCRG